MRYYAILLSLVALSLLGFQNSFAVDTITCKSCVQIEPKDLDYYKTNFPLIIWTDDAVYNHDSSITVNGYIRPQNNIAPVLVTVTNPIGNIVTIEQLEADENGDFSFILKPTGPLWTSDGNYIIHATSGSENRAFKTQVSIVSFDIGTKSSCPINQITIKADNGGVYCMSYKVTKGEVTGIDGTLDVGAKTLTLNVRGNDVESLILNVPRNVIDSKINDDDSEFVITSKGVVISYTELEGDSDTRKIQLRSVPDHRATYVITGTHVVPEFGVLVFAVLIATISTLVLIGKFSSIPFYKNTV